MSAPTRETGFRTALAFPYFSRGQSAWLKIQPKWARAASYQPILEPKFARLTLVVTVAYDLPAARLLPLARTT